MSNDSQVGALRVDATLDTGKFVEGTKTIQRETKATETVVSRSFEGMRGAIEGFASAFAVGALVDVTEKALDYAGSLGKVSQQLGVSTRDLQVFRFAASQTGVSQSELETGLQRLTVTLGKVAAGASAPAKALQAIGISVKDVAGKDAGEAFRMIADGLEKVTDRSQRAAVEVALFGRTGSMLDNMLSGGSARINELGDAAQRLGIILSPEQIERADQAALKFGALKTVLQANIAGIVANNANSILKLADSLGWLISKLGTALRAYQAFAAGMNIADGWLNAHGPFGTAKTRAEGNIQLVQGQITLRDLQRQQAGGTSMEERAAKFRERLGMGTPPPGKNIGQFLAPKVRTPRAPRIPRTPRGPADHGAQYDHQYDEDQLRNEKEILSAQRDLSHSIEERTAISLKLIQIEHDEQASKIDYNEKQHKLTAGQADKERAQNDTLTALKRQAVLEEQTRQKEEDAFQMQETKFSIQRQALQSQLDLATTADERRKIELELLDLAYEEKKTALDKIAAGKDLAAAERARAELAAMPDQKAADKKVVEKSNQGPWADFVGQGSPEKIQEQMEELKVQGVGGLVDALSHAGEGWKAMRDIAISSIKDILAQMIRLQIMKAIFNIAGAAAGGGGGSAGLGEVGVTDPFGGGSIGTAPDLSGIGGMLPKFAGGGSFTALGKHGVDQNVMSIGGLPMAKISYGERVSIGNDNGPRGGDLHVHVTAPNTGNAAQDRRTSMQQAADVSTAINRARSRGF